MVITDLIDSIFGFPFTHPFLVRHSEERSVDIANIYVTLIIAPLKFIQSLKLGGIGKGNERGKGPYILPYPHRKFLKSDMSKSRRHVVVFPVNPNFCLIYTRDFNK